MRFVTTLLLLIATGGVAGLWYIQRDRARNDTASVADGSNKLLSQITPTTIRRVEVGDVTLERTGNTWRLPGDWPTRTADVDNYLQLLSDLNTRFAPVPFTQAKDFGFEPDQHPLVLKVTIAQPNGADATHTLTFGEPASERNAFTRPTYMRIDDSKDVLRLAPGLIARLRRSREDFLRRQLFPEVVRTKFSDESRGGMDELPPPAVPVLNATSIAATSPNGAWSLRRLPDTAAVKSATPKAQNTDKLAEQWELTAPAIDHVDPDKLRSILTAAPDLWVERFVNEPDQQKTGLDQPERTLTVKTTDGELKVLVGKVSRTEIKPAPPPPQQANPFAPPPPPQQPTKVEFRYAKLPNNPQVFEVRTDKFDDLFVRSADLRDAKLIRFKPADVKKIEIATAGKKLVFSKEKDAGSNVESWKMLEPNAAPAEPAKLTELLDKLAGLQARGEDVIDAADRKPYGLADGEPVTTVTLTWREEEPGPTPEVPKKEITRSAVLRLGKDDLAKSKLYVQVGGIPRVDAVPDDLMKLVDRPIIAYRSRRVIDVPSTQLATIAVERPADAFTLTQKDDKWSLTSPVAAPVDAAKASALAGDLGRLEAVEFANFSPTQEELKNFGLDTPNTKVVVTFTDDKQPAKTLLIGKAREGRPELYAKLADSPEVFAVRPALKETIDRPSLALRPTQLWQVAGPDVQSIEVEQGNTRFALKRDGAQWKVSGPFNATAFLPAVQPLLEAASAPRAEKFAAHTNEDLKNFGLDTPSTILKVSVKGDKPDAKDTIKELLIGKPVADGQAARYARLGDQPGVFIIPSTVTESVDKPALDYLDRRLLQVDVRQVNRLEGAGASGPWAAKKDGDKWTIDSLTPPAAGDRTVIDGVVNAFADVRAQKFAAYSPTDWAQFGLDKPVSTVTVSLPAGDKAVTHTIALGKPVDEKSASRFARIDNGPAVAVLPTPVSNELTRSALDLVDRGMFNFDAKDLVSIRRQSNGQELLLEKKDGAWQMAKPQVALADDPAVTEMAERLAHLRAIGVAALSAKDLKPFGLDGPTATYTLQIKEADGRTTDKILTIGGAAPNGRYAAIGTDMVYVIPDSGSDTLATRLLADPTKFRDRTLARFNDADRVTITRGGRTATFAKVDGAWKMTAPLAADAEGFDLDDLILAASKLRADELVADNPGDLKEFGLDKPEADIRFYLGDKEVMQLFVSAKGADGRVAVKSAGGDLVGKLDAGLSGRVLAEFRKRALWPNLDVAQADTVIINAGAGGTPLILQKDAAGWQATGRAEKAKLDAVSDLLATLAGLKAERYIVDQKADLKLYGLEPPERVIVVKSRGQTTTLHLGRFEGDSKRAYATVPGAGWVVVLSEADSGKLLKPAAEFVNR